MALNLEHLVPHDLYLHPLSTKNNFIHIPAPIDNLIWRDEQRLGNNELLQQKN